MYNDLALQFAAFALIILAVLWVRYRMQLYQMKWDRKMMWAEIREEQESRND